ncbi:hypothetical protein GGR57DRAFT_500947 [Xylariaceae sp. FL1272]|nr:hypothetical protein GGR57DRAFT_500947 [Xylariaceae sp. FL1272]
MQKKQKPSKASDWSPWEWSPKYNCYYRSRYNHHGKLEYSYKDASSSVPRTAEDPVMNQLSSDIGNVSLEPTSYEEPQHHQYTDQAAYSTDSTAHDHSTSPQYTHHGGYQQQYSHPQSHSSSHSHPHSHSSSHAQPHSHSQSYSRSSKGRGRDKSKGKGVADPSFYEEDPVGEINHAHTQVDPHAQASSYTARSRSYDDPYYDDNYSHEADEAAMQQAMADSRAEHYGHGHQGGGESSFSPATYGTSTFDPSAYEQDSNPYPEGDRTPRGSVTANTSYGSSFATRNNPQYSITGTHGMSEPADPRFVVEHSKRFQPGEVFKILWSEPMGAVGGDEISDIQSIGSPGSRFYVGYRRFIIVSTDESHHSTCVPILTYDRRGCLKKGVKESKHGIVYAMGKQPKLLKKEPALGYDPVEVEIYAEGETLARESRVNYSKLVTIEHNVKVFFMGRVNPEYLDIVTYAVNKCWEEKTHKAFKKSKK